MTPQRLRLLKLPLRTGRRSSNPSPNIMKRTTTFPVGLRLPSTRCSLDSTSRLAELYGCCAFSRRGLDAKPSRGAFLCAGATDGTGRSEWHRESALLTTLAIRFLAYFTGQSTLDS